MIKRLIVDKMTCIKILLMLINLIISVSGPLMLFTYHDIWTRDYLRDYMDISAQEFNFVKTFDDMLLFFVVENYMLPSISVIYIVWIVQGRPALLYYFIAGLALTALLNLIIFDAVASEVYRNNMYERFDQDLNESMAAYGQNSKSSHIDTMQSTLKCCGNRGYADWLNLDPPKDIPLSCCKVPQDKCEPQDLEQIYTEGCYNLVLGTIGLMAGMMIGTILFLLIGTFLSCCLASNINKVKQGVRCKETDLHTKDNICFIHIWNKIVCAVPKSGKVTDEVRQKE